MAGSSVRLIEVYNEFVLFASIHFVATGMPPNVPKKVAARRLEMSAQEHLLVAIKLANEFMSARESDVASMSAKDVALCQSLCLLIGASRDFLMWSSTWVNFVRDKVVAQDGGFVAVRSPAVFDDTHQILCYSAGMDFMACFGSFCLAYRASKRGGSSTWPFGYGNN